MFTTGDLVLYSSEGVCKVTEITTKTFGDESIEYFVLTPVFRNTSTFFVPVKSEKLTSKMHSLIDHDDFMHLISEQPGELCWIENDSQRKESFKDKITSGNVIDVIFVFRLISKHKEEIEKLGKNLHKADETTYKDARRILHELLCMGMEVSKDNVEDIILGKTIE